MLAHLSSLSFLAGLQVKSEYHLGTCSVVEKYEFILFIVRSVGERSIRSYCRQVKNRGAIPIKAH